MILLNWQTAVGGASGRADGGLPEQGESVNVKRA